ncbi:hypothetical protein [Candidatus Finniella inopinata]|uniref:Uncharacterized protein n=1 Tax=Candidatus Finniella inopinata TaxID=1696036 RepID=A0A4Q7DJK8_9PROT|nr:hypothetical protein [Candidatus Finniella inopinata]RZI46224.1 hypothetical protein EQU50_04630 [Candidatus Finniella inopinata]
MAFILIILFLFNINFVNAQTVVQELHVKSQQLKSVRSVSNAVGEVGQLRHSLSGRPLERDATAEERAQIIEAIVNTETAAMLIDGAYDFKFSRTAYGLPSSLSEREQIHYGWIFCLARTSQLLAENPVFDQTDISVLLGRDANSRHMPAWMKDIFQKNLRQIDWVAYVRPYLAVEKFALVETRKAERAGEPKRPQFTVTITQEHIDAAFRSNTVKGIPFEASAFLKPGNYIFDAYAISPDGACQFYGCQGPYGYFGRSDFGEQIVDNMDSDPRLDDLVKSSIAYDFYVWLLPERDIACSVINSAPDCSKYLIELGIESSKSRTSDVKLKELKESLKKTLTSSSAKEIVSRETNKFLFKTNFGGEWLTYADLIAYLNSLNIYAFYKHDKPGVLTLASSQSHVSYAHGRSTFLLSANRHVTRLVLRDNSIASLFEYIRAKAHEEKNRLDVNSASYKCWM